MAKEDKELVVRTGISFDTKLLEEFDTWFKKEGFPNRSEALRYIVRQKLSEEKIKHNPDEQIIGTLSYIFDHHVHNSSYELTSIQHNHQDLIVSTMHVHVSHELCLETILLKGKVKDVQKFTNELLTFKGVLTGKLYIATI